MGQWLIILGAIAFIVFGLKKFSTTTRLRVGIILLILGIISLFISTQGHYREAGFGEIGGKGIATMIGIAGLLIGGIFLAGSIGKKKAE